MMVLNSPARFARPVAGESLFYRNFNRRFGILLWGATLAYPVVFGLVCLTQSISFPMAAIHLAMYLAMLSFLWLSRVRDSATAFLVTHPFWFYSFSLFAYALGHWKSPETDLYAPWLSSMVAFVALLAAIAGYALAKGFRAVFGLPRQRPRQTASDNRQTGIGLVVIAAPLLLLPAAISRSSFLAAVSGMFEPVLWLGLLTYCAGRGMRAFVSPVLLFVALVAFADSIAFNGRAILFAFGLTVILAYIGLSRHPLRFGRLVLFYLIVNAANAFSYAMLSARLIAGRDNSAGLALQTMFSSDFALAVLGFDTMSDNASVVNDQLVRHDKYLLYMFDGRLGISERLTELPHMDIVLSRLPFPMTISWSEIANAVLSALPSVGQDKDIIFNDRLVWDTRLAVYGNVGHPLVTAAGEFYAMGGFIVLFLFFSIMIGVTLYFYEASRRLFADHFIAAASLICFSLYMVTTSTSVSALSVPMRIYPMILILYPIIKRTWQAFSPRLSKAGTQLGPVRAAR